MTREELEYLQRYAQEQQRQQAHAHLTSEEQQLLAKMPEWKDNPEKAKKEIADIKRHLIDHHGYTEEEVAVIPSHKNLLAARELMLSHQREQESKRRASEERTKRERRERAEADKAAEKRGRLDEAKKTVRRHPLSTEHGAQALADALDED